MFGPKKTKVSKKDLKKAIVNANDKMRAANARMKLDIAAGNDKLKSIGKDYDSYKEALEDTKEMQVLANNELEGTQFEIAEAQTTVKEVLSKLSNVTEESNSLEKSNKNLKSKSSKLTKSISLLEEKKSELVNRTANLKQIKKEEADGQESLDLLAEDLNELATGVESYANRKSAAESEFKAFMAKIAQEKDNATEEFNSIKDRMAATTLSCGKEMGRLDKSIAERMSELKDMEELLKKKSYEFVVIQSKIGSVERRVQDTEERIEYVIKKEKDRVSKIRGEFKDWKVQALDEVARKRLKGQIENIDKAGLKDILDG